MSKLRLSLVNIIDEIGVASGCHRMPERSFFYKGHQFPVCARCTGVFLGQCIALIINIFKNIPCKTSIACLTIMGFDWGMQEINIKESTNRRRLITGFLGGFGLFNVYCILFKKIYRYVKHNVNCKNKNI